MRLYHASSPRVEVNGETVLTILGGMGAYRARGSKILASHGLGDLKPGNWYLQQAWLDAFRDIHATLGPNVLYRIGLEIPNHARFPAQIGSIEQGLEAIDKAYKMNHRGGDIGSYGYCSTGPRSAKIVCDNPYPPDFDRGIIQAIVNRFKPEGSAPIVEVDATEPDRTRGGESHTYLVSW